MPSHPTETPAPDNPGQPAGAAHAHHQVLDELIEIGAGLARLLHSQATAQAATQAPAAPAPQPAPAPDALIAITVAFDRVARAVRRCIMLARTLNQPIPAAPDPAQHRTAARKRIVREVEDAIQRAANATGRADADALHAELHDRLDAPDLDDDIGSRPTADVIADICRDLGLAALAGAQPWRRRTPADIAQLCARAAAPSAPQPGTVHPFRAAACPAPTPADHPAQSIATIPRGPPHLHDQWRPPPGA